MMFRSNWGSRPNQQRVLAIWLKREAFEKYLEQARTKGSVRGMKGTVRLQWDPDHFPDGSKHPYRRAVQLGLKNIETFADGTDILWIEDISDAVHEEGRRKWRSGDELNVARERVYVPESKLAREALNLSEE